MGSVCECCVSAYCSCLGSPGSDRKSGFFLGNKDDPRVHLQVGFQKQWEVWNGSWNSGQQQACLVHSHCSFCNRPLSQASLQHERSVKRKFAKVYAEDQLLPQQEDGEVLESGGQGAIGLKSPKKQKDVGEGMEICENEQVRRLMEALEAEREAVNALYVELEEERNAAAVAATETLAMITRLQEEKAAVQMEASQYKRMVEERTEYDQEAIGMLNDILARQEEEKVALSKEVEMYRTSLKKRMSNCEDGGRFVQGGALKAEDDEYMTPLVSTLGTVRGNLQSRNLMASFEEVESNNNLRTGNPNKAARGEKAGSSSRVYSPPRRMDIDECSESSGVHNVAYDRGNRPASSGRRGREDEFMEKCWGNDGEEYPGGQKVWKTARKLNDRHGKPNVVHRGSGGLSSSSMSRNHDTDEENEEEDETPARIVKNSRRVYGRPDSTRRNCGGLYSSSVSRDEEHEDQRIVRRSGHLPGELRELSKRLQALEADREFSKHSRRGGTGDMDILQEISQQLRHIHAQPDDVKEMSEASFVFSFKGFFSFNGLRQSLHSNLNRLACMFLKQTDAGLNYGDHVGLSHLLENSRKARAVTRGFKVDGPPLLPSSSSSSSSYNLQRQNVEPHNLQHWPAMDARGRSETAFGGWDY